MGYEPRESSEKGRKHLKIGVVTQLAGSSFMIRINQGIEDAARLLGQQGVTLLCRNLETIDEEQQLEVIDQLVDEGIDGLGADADSV